MSGSTIGSFAGAGLGFLIGGPAGAKIGWMVGGLVGGIIAPEKIYGPRLTDARSQTASDGVPRTYGYGTFPTTGNLLWRDPTINEVETSDDGKGGPKQISYTYTRSYAIGVCRGPIAGYLIIKRNGKVVYDTRTDAELAELGYTAGQISETRAAQAKWAEVATLYYGDDAQMPDPTIQAVKGAGNVPAYRGSAYIVCTDDDVTDLQGAVPQYDFVVSQCGTVGSTDIPTNRILITGTYPTSVPSAARWSAATPGDIVPFTRIPDSTGADVAGAAFPAFHDGVWSAVRSVSAGGRTSVDDRATWTTSTLPGTVTQHVGGAEGFLARMTTGDLALSDMPPTVYTTIVGGGNTYYISYTDGYYYLTKSDNTFRRTQDFVTITTLHTNTDNYDDYLIYHEVKKFGGAWYATRSQQLNYATRKWQLVSSASGLFNDEVILIDLPPGVNKLTYLDVVGNQLAVYRGGGYIYRSGDGFTTPVSCGLSAPQTYSSGSELFSEINGRKMASDNGRLYVIGIYGSGEVAYSDDLENWTLGNSLQNVTTAIAGAGEYAVPTVGTELPDAPGHYVDDDGVISGTGGTAIERCTPELGEIVENQCAVRGVTTVDVSELTDLVDGFRVASETSPQRNIQALQVGYFFDGAEYDGVLHFPKRGAAASFALTWDDFVSRDGDPIEWEVTKENELLRKATVGYIDPATTYTPTTQNWERRAGTIAAQGEGTIDLAVTGDKDWAKQAAEKHVKAAWAETKECKFSVSVAHAALVTGQVGTIQSSDGGEHLIRITRIEDDGDVRRITARKTQPNAYASTATGVTINPPRFPGTPLSGPTVSAAMNLPVLRDEDDKAGVYWAATGLLTNWPGAGLTLSRDGVTFENGPQMTVRCTMGVLTAPLPDASRYALDTTNTLSVRLYPGARELSNASYDTLLASEANVAAILYADGTAEILQFASRVSTGTREYDLTGLIRGRLDTETGLHAEGAIFVLLDDAIRFAAIRPDDLGKTLTFRAVTFGTVADSNPTQTITFTTIESLREWQPYNVEIEDDGSGGYCISWIGRARLGSDAFPQHSQFFAGYSVRLTDGVVIHDIDTSEQSVCVDSTEMTAIFGGGYGVPTVSVVAKSTSSQQAYNGAAPTGWVAEAGTWVEDPAGTYTLRPDGVLSGRMYYDTPYSFTTGTIDASVDIIGPQQSAFLRVDFMDASGVVFITENGSSVTGGGTSVISITAASLAPFGTVAYARVYLSAVSGSPIPSPVTFSSLSVVVTP